MENIIHNGHLSDEAISLYAEGLKQDKIHMLPETITGHIESCNSCHAQAIELYSLLKDIDQSGEGPHPYFDKKPENVFPMYKAAGLVAAMLVVAALFFFLNKGGSNSTGTPDNPIVEQDSSLQETKLPIDTLEIDIEEEKPIEDPQPIAMAFKTNGELDDLVNSVYRSSDLSIQSPKNGTSFVKNKAIPFSWKGGKEQRYLIILDNKGKQISRRLVNVNQLEYKDDLNAGLYYWKLESEDDLLHVGKFNIK